MQAPWWWPKTETCRSDIYVYLNVNFNVFFKLIKVHLLVSELYTNRKLSRAWLYCGVMYGCIVTEYILYNFSLTKKYRSLNSGDNFREICLNSNFATPKYHPVKTILLSVQHVSIAEVVHNHVFDVMRRKKCHLAGSQANGQEPYASDLRVLPFVRTTKTISLQGITSPKMAIFIVSTLRISNVTLWKLTANMSTDELRMNCSDWNYIYSSHKTKCVYQFMIILL